MRAFFLLPLLFMFILPPLAQANNLAVTNIALVGKDTTNDDIDIEFDIGWDNSWRAAGAPLPAANWDAAWVFAKFSKFSGGSWGDWTHCTLLSTGAVAVAGSTMVFAATGARLVGAFVYRDAAGSGANDWDDLRMRWDYGADNVADGEPVKVKLFGIEMVYVSSGPFYVGDADNDQPNSFYEGGTGPPRGPLLISSEGAITVADTPGNLYYDNDNSDSGDRAGPIPANFPKGVNPFYLMKYEISQRQYCEFLNTLNVGQQSNRHDVGSNFNSSRNFIKKTSASPAFFGVDADNDAGSATAADKTKLNEANDGEWVACNWLSYMDVAAYADWSGLRPFTELEFEKAARGGQMVANDEYAWGNATLETNTSSLVSAGTASEAPNQGNLNHAGVSPSGPFRVGGYADASSNRQNAGAGYYGALDLSGNLYERPVTLGNATGRAFTGSHGDGVLSVNGHATNSDWPGLSGGQVVNATGSGFRGGSWSVASSNARVADRVNASNISTIRNFIYGGRCARTSP